MYSNFKKTTLGHDNLTDDFILYIRRKVLLGILKILKSQCCHTYVTLFYESIKTVLKEINREPECIRTVEVVLYTV
jgi:hypothetical protein